MAIVYLSLGSNIGTRQVNLASALYEIGERIGDVYRISWIYETGSWGFESDNFLNQVVEVDTQFDPESLITKCLEIEKDLGRIRKYSGSYSSRIIDIDILFYDDLVLKKENLTIPHPYLQERKFILVPLNEVIPNFMHPLLQKTISQLLEDCDDAGMVKLYDQ